MSEKEAHHSTVTSASADESPLPAGALPTSGNGDDALDFLKQHGTVNNFSQDAARMRKLRRKIDIHVIPFLLSLIHI